MSTFTLQPLLDLMQTRTDEATRRLGKLLAAEQSARKQLQMLEEYRSEYAESLRQAARQGLSPLALRNYQGFLDRIDQAITQQTAAVRHSERETAHGQAQWRAQHTQLKAIDTLAQRHQARARVLDNKREQKLLDELTTQRFARQQDDGEEPT